ncbi:MAG: HAMP domain-containing sensor histidine kinase [Solirubrobacterales bacterium]
MLDRLAVALERERAFVDDASHELRTPLSLHKTELELALRYGENPAELKASIASAIEEVDRLIQLAEDMLVVARSEQGKLAVKLERVSAAALLEDVRVRFSARAEQADRGLVVQSSEGPESWVEVDPLRIRQALTNMVENALRHGAGDVTLSAQLTGDRVELHVVDCGGGFPPAFIDGAFERFSRADDARSRGGTGLGLAIVAAIARAHRGNAAARNPPAGGADVWLSIPQA